MKKAPTHKGNIKRTYPRQIPKVGWYSTSRWKRLRKLQLAKEPLCRLCKEQGYIVAATVVDHIEPHKGDYELFYDPDNLDSMCVTCHNRKTAKEDGGFGK